MDERALSLIFLLMAAVFPLRELAGKWAGRADRRGAIRALWAVYLLAAAGAVAALILTGRPERPGPPPMEGPEQFALRAPPGSGISAG